MLRCGRRTGCPCVLTICMIGFKAARVEPFASVGSASSNSAGVEAGSYHIASHWIFQLLCCFFPQTPTNSSYTTVSNIGDHAFNSSN